MLITQNGSINKTNGTPADICRLEMFGITSDFQSDQFEIKIRLDSKWGAHFLKLRSQFKRETKLLNYCC